MNPLECGQTHLPKVVPCCCHPARRARRYPRTHGAPVRRHVHRSCVTQKPAAKVQGKINCVQGHLRYGTLRANHKGWNTQTGNLSAKRNSTIGTEINRVIDVVPELAARLFRTRRSPTGSRSGTQIFIFPFQPIELHPRDDRITISIRGELRSDHRRFSRPRSRAAPPLRMHREGDWF